MIAITSESGALLKVIPWESGKTIGYHPQFGFASDRALHSRARNRKRFGFNVHGEDWAFAFRLGGRDQAHFKIEEPRLCQASSDDKGWSIKAGANSYRICAVTEQISVPVTVPPEERDYGWLYGLAVLLMIPVVYLLLPKTQPTQAPVVLEPIMVQIKPEVQKPVTIQGLEKLREVTPQERVVKRAVQQNLGFLGLIGRKDLTKAIGGAPTALKDASAGAGPGGKEGSGGELLVGLGEGLKRVTIGNSGVKGLGGVGTKGAGGGAGGYGNTAIGSGEGRALSAMPLSNDVTLDGGLDRSVVQATIAKYLSQVRACYEAGLKRNPGIGGQVTMLFEVGGGGDLNFAHVDKSSLGDAEVEQCIATRMLTWKFPQPRGGVKVKVSYPFLLRSTHG